MTAGTVAWAEAAARAFETLDQAPDRLWLRIRRPNQVPPPLVEQWFTWLILAGRGWGKALALDTPLPTPTGWTTMGDVKRGDLVIDETGTPCRVTYATEVQHGRTCYRVRFDDGSSIVADADHRWVTWDKQARKAHGRAQNPRSGPQVRTTEEIRATLTVQNGRERNHSIEVTKPLNLPAADLPVDPYVLGMWLGDGSSACAEVTIGDEDAEETLAYLAAAGERVSGPVRRVAGAKAATYPIGGHTPRRWDCLTTRLKRLGLIKNKHLPTAYLRASAEQRLALLQGLMDSDGSAQTGGHVEFMSCSEALGRGVFEIAASLGFKVVLAEERATLYGRDCGPRFRVSWTTDRPVFRLRRKVERLRTATAQANRTRHRYVVAVEPVESVPVRCITVDSPSHLYLAGEAMIPTHNTRVGAETIADLMRVHPGCRVALVAATFDDARDVMIEGESGLLAVLASHEIDTWNRSQGQLVLANGSRADVYYSEKPGNLRGPQHHFAWCDELAQWKDSWKDAAQIQTTWSNLTLGLRLPGRPGWPESYSPRVVVTTTPKPCALLKVPDEMLRTEPERAGLTQRGAEEVVITSGRTADNLDNLAEVFRKRVVEPLTGTRLGRQELDAELLTDVAGALLTAGVLSRGAVLPGEVPALSVTVTAVDPATTSKTTSDETGIVTVGASGPDVYVLEDRSLRGTPDEWARAVWDAVLAHGSSAVIVEDNAGGDMVETTLLTAWQTVSREAFMRGRPLTQRPPIVRVTPSGEGQGKWQRAQPVALLFEQGRAHMVRDVTSAHGLAQLEDQATSWTGRAGEKSPDRVDAMVHGITWVMFPAVRAGATRAAGPQRRGGVSRPR